MGLTLAFFLANVDFFLLSPLIPHITKNYGIKPVELTLLNTFYSLFGIVSGILGGPITHKFGSRRLIIFGLGLIGLVNACLFSGFFDSFQFLLVWRGVSGFSGILIFVNVYNYVCNCMPKEKVGSALGLILGVGGGAPIILGVPLGIYLAEKFSWGVPFFICSMIMILVAIYIYFILPKQLQEVKSEKKSEKLGFDLLRSQFNQIAPLLGIIVLWWLSFHGIYQVLQPFYAKHYALDGETLAQLIMGIGIGFSGGSYLAGRFANRLGTGKLMWTGAIMMATMALGFTCLVPELWLSVGMVICWSMGIGIGGIAINLMMATQEEGVRSTVLALNGAVIHISIVTASLLSGFILTFLDSFEVYGWVGLMVCVLVLVFERRFRSKMNLPKK